jgi:hypothetical protein
MQTTRLNSVLALSLLAIAVLACSATTANISALKVAKDESASKETSSFEASDTIYGVATISNAPGKVKVKGRLAIEDVEGQKPGPIPGLEKTLDLGGSGTATYTFTPPPSGWPKGKYKLEVILMNDAGEQSDTKSATFSVS